MMTHLVIRKKSCVNLGLIQPRLQDSRQTERIPVLILHIAHLKHYLAFDTKLKIENSLSANLTVAVVMGIHLQRSQLYIQMCGRSRHVLKWRLIDAIMTASKTRIAMDLQIWCEIDQFIVGPVEWAVPLRLSQLAKTGLLVEIFLLLCLLKLKCHQSTAITFTPHFVSIRADRIEQELGSWSLSQIGLKKKRQNRIIDHAPSLSKFCLD